MNTCHPGPKSKDHLTKLFMVVIIALTLFAAPMFAVDTNTFPLNGNVGIGTLTPEGKLHVFIGSAGVVTPHPNGNLLVVEGTTTNGFSLLTQDASSAMFMFGSPSNNRGAELNWRYTLNLLTFGTRNPGGQMSVITGNGVEAMRISSTGFVGLGTNAPTAKLHVAGNVIVTGNIAAKYQDVAEWVTATETMEPGTVVVLNPEKSNEVMPATRAYDTTVAGVVSANPGLTLGESAASKAQIATFGRVRVKASATEKPIHVGDLLVTSGKSGLAMKSEPMEIRGRAFHQPGTILGKALEPLASGEGEILVLLSLQ